MKTKIPISRRKFASGWDEVQYLRLKLLYWLYERESLRKARAFGGRLERLLDAISPDESAILAEECRSLLWEARGDLSKAILHRENEVRLMRRLHEVSQGKSWEYIARHGRGYDALSDRLDLLAVLYHDSGDRRQALALLRESKRLCVAHGIAFDGEDLMEDYLREAKASSGRRQDAAG